MLQILMQANVEELMRAVSRKCKVQTNGLGWLLELGRQSQDRIRSGTPE